MRGLPLAGSCMNNKWPTRTIAKSILAYADIFWTSSWPERRLLWSYSQWCKFDITYHLDQVQDVTHVLGDSSAFTKISRLPLQVRQRSPLCRILRMIRWNGSEALAAAIAGCISSALRESYGFHHQRQIRAWIPEAVL